MKISAMDVESNGSEELMEFTDGIGRSLLIDQPSYAIQPLPKFDDACRFTVLLVVRFEKSPCAP